MTGAPASQPPQEWALGKDREQLLAAVRDVPGVADAQLCGTDSEPGVLQLDLVAAADESAVAVAVARLLDERFGVGVDSASVALVERAAGLAALGDLQLLAVTVHSAGRRATASVRLRHGEREEEGSAAGPASAAGVLTAVVGAVADAVESLSDGALEVAVHEVRETTDGTVRVRLAVGSGDDVGGMEAAEAIRSDPRQAAARAAIGLLAAPLAARAAGPAAVAPLG